MPDDDLPLAHPDKQWWTIADIAAYWGVKPKTVRQYRGMKGRLPGHDDRIGAMPVWRPSTVIEFKRPGPGYRSDLKDSDR